MVAQEHLLQQLQSLRGSKTIILGVGNTLKGDDGIGPLVCQQLTGKIDAEIIDAGTVPENYIQKIIKKAPENLVIIDAADFAGPPGQIKLLQTEQLSSTVFSTHSLSPRLFLDMIRSEIKLKVYFIGIQPAHVELGQSLSAEAKQAVTVLVDTFIQILGVGQ
jgi:hydrogenase 3 maturation protease